MGLLFYSTGMWSIGGGGVGVTFGLIAKLDPFLDVT